MCHAGSVNKNAPVLESLAAMAGVQEAELVGALQFLSFHNLKLNVMDAILKNFFKEAKTVFCRESLLLFFYWMVRHNVIPEPR